MLSSYHPQWEFSLAPIKPGAGVSKVFLRSSGVQVEDDLVTEAIALWVRMLNLAIDRDQEARTGFGVRSLRNDVV